MKPPILYIIIGLISIFTPVAAQQTLNLSNKTLSNKVVDTAPVREMQSNDDGISVTYTFSNAKLMPDPLFSGATMWAIDGFGVNYIPEEPAILFRSDLIAIPNGAEAVLSLEDCEYIDFESTLSPARQLLFADDSTQYSLDNVQPIAPYSGFFPPEIATTSNPQSYRGTTLQRVNIAPIQYDYENHIVRIYTKLQYKLSYNYSSRQNAKSSADEPQPYISPTDYFISDLTLNAACDTTTISKAASSDYAIADTRGYLIITTPSLIEPAKRLADWKKQLGFKTHIICNNNWTIDRVKSQVRNYYSKNPSLYYLLILGGQNDVPAEPNNAINAANHYEGLTDYFYGCTSDDRESIPNIHGGRIPVSNATEANTVIDKIINYEKTPSTDAAFYNTGLHCAYFEESPDNHSKENFSFVYVSEKIKNHVETQGKRITRQYLAEDYASPMLWNETRTEGGAIPTELQRPAFKWNCTPQSISDSINSGAFYTLYSGHGNELSWASIDYYTSDLQKLTNRTKLPVVFSITCSNGDISYSSPCFAQTMLTHTNGGCVSMIAAMAKSLQGLNDGIAYGIFGAIWPNPALNATIKFPPVGNFNNHYSASKPIYDIGRILSHARLRCRETWGTINDTRTTQFEYYNREIYQCFGDPSMEIITQKPTNFSRVNISRSNNLTVDIYDQTEDPVRITLYDPIGNIVNSFVGKHLTYSSSSPQSINVCITSHNKIPFLDQGVIFLQNETIGGFNKILQAPIIIAGENVTDSKSSGNAIFTSGTTRLRSMETIFENGVTISGSAELHIEFQDN